METIDATATEVAPSPATQKRKPSQSIAKAETRQASAPAIIETRSELDKILALAENPAIPVDRIAAVIDLFRGVEKDRARRAFDDAMAKAKAEFPPILKNRTVKHKTRSGDDKEYDHEDLFGIASIVDPILGKHGLSYRYRTSSEPNQPISVTCIITGFGHSEETTLHGGRDESGNKNAMQAIGSSLTYLQRYTLKAALGLAAGHDDDGEASSLRPSEQGNEYISDDQVNEILTLVPQSGMPIEQYLRIIKLNSVEDIFASKYAAAKKLLTDKIDDRKRRAANNGGRQ